jgi:prepilin-type processing-associated H-X9-DG protein
LGLLWSTKLIGEGKVFYCPSNLRGDNLAYDYYSEKKAWPWGINLSPASGAPSNPGYVRSGYSYYPQLAGITNVSTAAGNQDVAPANARATTTPESTWICVSPMKLASLDVKRSMIVDVIYKSLDLISHKGTSAKSPAGLNAAFPDGHVAWQNKNRIPAAFNQAVWTAIEGGSVNDLRYVESLWQP